mmetsp:Transcript_6580/g.15036  ORF Transcript_6580/g.15036 Transcript_6580/m.15036 type:complete len:221 (-) Transcript_6580:2408-3070(-)
METNVIDKTIARIACVSLFESCEQLWSIFGPFPPGHVMATLSQVCCDSACLTRYLIVPASHCATETVPFRFVLTRSYFASDGSKFWLKETNPDAPLNRRLRKVSSMAVTLMIDFSFFIMISNARAMAYVASYDSTRYGFVYTFFRPGYSLGSNFPQKSVIRLNCGLVSLKPTFIPRYPTGNPDASEVTDSLPSQIMSPAAPIAFAASNSSSASVLCIARM